MASVKCTHCSESVYPMEKMVLGDKPYHRGCAKCSHCQSTLSISSFSVLDGKLFCKPHFMELFKASGGKYSFENKAGGPLPASAVVPVVQQQESKQPNLAQQNLRPVSTVTTTTTAVQKESGVVAPQQNLRPVSARNPPNNNNNSTSQIAANTVVLRPVAKSVLVEEKLPAPVVVTAVPTKVTNTVVTTAAAVVPVTPNKLSQFLQQHETPAAAVPASVVPKPAAVNKLTAFLEQSTPKAIKIMPSTADSSTVTDTKPVVAPVKLNETVVKPVVVAPTVQLNQVAVKLASVSETPVKLAVKPASVSETPVKLASEVPPPVVVESQVKRLKSTEMTTGECKCCETKIKALEMECASLKAHIAVSDSGKEELIHEIMRLNTLLNSVSENPPRNAAMETQNESKSVNSRVELSLGRAKQLMQAGKITKSQYDAASRAAFEAVHANDM